MNLPQTKSYNIARDDSGSEESWKDDNSSAEESESLLSKSYQTKTKKKSKGRKKDKKETEDEKEKEKENEGEEETEDKGEKEKKSVKTDSLTQPLSPARSDINITPPSSPSKSEITDSPPPPTSPMRSRLNLKPIFTSTPSAKNIEEEMRRKGGRTGASPQASRYEAPPSRACDAQHPEIVSMLIEIQKSNRLIIENLKPVCVPYIENEIDIPKMEKLIKSNPERVGRETWHDRTPTQFLDRHMARIVCSQISWKLFQVAYPHFASMLVNFYNNKPHKPMHVPTLSSIATAKIQCRKWWSNKKINAEKKAEKKD